MKRLLFCAAAIYAICFAVAFAADVEMGKANGVKAQAVKSQAAKQATKPALSPREFLETRPKSASPTAAAENTYRRRLASMPPKAAPKFAPDLAQRVAAADAAKLRAKADHQAQVQWAQAALFAAQQQANAQAQAQQNAQQQALTNALLWQLLNQPPASPAPLINPGPYNETIMHVGNQTWINGSGPYGPFNETIQHIGNETFVNGYGVPPGPWVGGYGFGGGY